MNHYPIPKHLKPGSFSRLFAQPKSLLYACWSLLLVFCALPRQAAAVLVTIGSATNNSSTYPGLYNYYAFSSSESIYTAAELGSIGKISSYALSKQSGPTTAIDSVYIYMKESAVDKVTTTSSMADYTLVYKGAFPNTAATGWMTVNLDTKFTYTGTGNLHILVLRRNATTSTSYNYYHTTYNSAGGFSSGYYYKTTDPWSGTPATSTQYTTTYYRTDIQLNIDPFDPCTGTPAAGTAIASKTITCGGESVRFKVSGATLASGITYAWDTAAAGTTAWALAGTSTTTPGDWSFTPPPGRSLDYRCRSVCSAGGTEVVSSTVTVAAGSIATLPYFEDFESETPGTNVACAEVLPRWDAATGLDANSSSTWRLLNGSVSTSTLGWGPYSGDQYLHAGYLIGYSSNLPGYWFTPAFELRSGSTYRFSYRYRVSDYIARNYSSTGVDVGMYYGTDNKSAADLVPVKPDLRIQINTDYLLTEGDFTVPATGYYYLAVKVDNNAYPYYGGTMIEDVGLRQLPACTTAIAADFASGGKAAASTTTLCALPGSVDLSLSGTPGYSGLDFSWEVATGSPSGFSATGLTTAKASFNITSGGTYYLRCKVSCAASGLTAYSDTLTIKTTPITPPYFEDFESGNSGVNMPCAANTGTFAAGTTSGWDIRIAPYGTSAPGIVNHTPGGSKYLFAGYYMGSIASSVPRFWFTPGLSLTEGKAYEFSMWVSNNMYLPSSYSSSSIDLGIRVGTAQTEAAMTLVAGDDTTIAPNLDAAPEYHPIRRGFIAPATGTFYVGISYNCTGSAFPGVAIDDIGLNQLPACSARPVAGMAKAKPGIICSSGTASLSLTGTSMASDLKFQWQVSASGLPGSWSHVSTGTGGTSPVYTSGTLSSGPWYYRCIVSCPLSAAPNADTSLAVKVSVGALDLPYSEDFETATAGVNVDCASQEGTWNATSLLYWNIRSGAYSTSYPGITNRTPGGRKYLYSGYYNGPFYGSGSDKFFWFTPALKMTSGKGYTVSFWYNGTGSVSGYNGLKLGIYAGTAQNAAGMTIRAGGKDSNVVASTNLYRNFRRSFVAPTTGNYYVGIKTAHTGYNYPGIPIDDINITEMSDCSGKPVAGTADASPAYICAASGTTTLRLSGTSVASGIRYQWQAASAATGPWANATGGSGAATGDYTTATLTASTWYRCVVSCTASGQSDTSAAIRINVGVLTPPYTETFENTIVGNNVPCAAVNGTWGTASASSAWTVKGTSLNSSAPWIQNRTPGGSNYLHAGTSIGTYSTSTPQYWFSPGIRLEAGATYQFSYWYNGSGYAGGITNLGMYYGTAQTAAAMNLLTPELTEVNTSSYKQFAGRFSPASSGVYYMGIKVNHTNYTNYGAAIDDINLEQLPPCTGVPTAGAVSTNPSMVCTVGGTAVLNMDLSGVTKASGLSYRWEWSNDNFATVAGSGAAQPTPAYTSPGLSSLTYFRCIVKCTATNDSVISDIVKVQAGVIVPPYYEDFESGTAGKNMPCASFTGSWSSGMGWYLYNGPYSSYATADNHTPGGSKYLMAGYGIGTYSYGASYWFTPAIRFEAGQLYQLSFWYNGTGYSASSASSIATFYGSAQTAAAMTNVIAPELSGINTRVYTRFVQQFTPLSSGNYHIGIRVDNGSTYNPPGIAIDDIGLEQVPACDGAVTAGSIFSDPEHVCSIGDAANLSLSGATLATGLSYTWQAAKDKTGPYVTVGSGLPYATDPLMENTWFRAIITCDASKLSDTTVPLRISVGGFDLPYIEDFESTPAGIKPLCSEATTWGTSYFNGWNVYNGTYSGAYTNHTPGGKRHLIAGYYMGAGTTTGYPTVTEDNYWFTPGLNLHAGYKYRLSFWYLASSGGVNQNRMGVFFGTSQSPAAMVNTIIPFQLFNNTSYEEADETFEVSTSGVYYLGFKKSSEKAGTYSYNGVAFDDINLNYADCDGLPAAGTITGTVSSGTALCNNTMVTLSSRDATFGQVPGIRYQWQRKGLTTASPADWTAIAGANDSTLSSDTLVGYQYRLAVICTHTHDTAVTAAFQLPENPPHPAVTLSPGTSPMQFCAGDTIHLIATSFPAAVYDWIRDGVVVPGWKFNDISITEAGNYSVRVSSPVSPCSTRSAEIKIEEINPGYTVTVTKPADSIICAGNSVLLSAVASKTGISYSWMRNNTLIPGANGPTYLVAAAGSYRVLVSDGISTCPAASRPISFTVRPNPEAEISVPGGTLTACAEDGVVLKASNNGYAYQWSRGGSAIFGWNDSVVTIKNSGVYAVEIRNAEGCVSRSRDIDVHILPTPAPVISRSGMILSAGPGSFVAYRWERTGLSGTATEGTGATLTLTKKGRYRVIVTDANGCEGSSAPFDITDETLSVEQLSSDVRIKVFPNPTGGQVNVDCPVAVRLAVKDATGRVVLEARDGNQADLSRFADGIYLLQVYDAASGVLLHQEKISKQSR